MINEDLLNEFEGYLKAQLAPLKDSRTRDAMEYSLMAGGKRVRPRLLFEVLDGYGIDPHQGFAAAAALEMIHTYSLIHDDLPGMDNDDLRRGRPTCHKAFDEATAILAGDGLQYLAMEQLLKSDASSDDVLKLVQLYADKAGVQGMIYGQDLDMQSDSRQQDLDTLLQIDEYKTGCLLQIALMAGALLAGHPQDMPAWQQVGKNLGLEFQVQDDILDATKSAEQLGKSNSDARNEKLTAVSLLGLEEAKAFVERCDKTVRSETSRILSNPTSILSYYDVLLKRDR